MILVKLSLCWRIQARNQFAHNTPYKIVCARYNRSSASNQFQNANNEFIADVMANEESTVIC